MTHKPDSQLMFGELLAHLRQHGFPIGVDHYLRLQELLDKVGDRCAPEDLKTLLAPVFATSPAQQEQFYRAYDSYFSLFEPATLRAPSPRPVLQVRPQTERRPVAQPQRAATGFQKKWLYLLVPVVVVLAIVLGLVISRRRGAETVQNTAPQPAVNTNAGAPPVIELPSVDPPASGQPGAGGTTMPPPNQPGTVQPAMPAGGSPPTAPPPGFYQRYRIVIYLLALLVPLALFFIYEWHKRRQRKLLPTRERRKKAPYVWPVRTRERGPKLFDSEQFYNTARVLRRRQVDEFYRLDVEATIAATIAALGYPSFRYQSASKLPEYLVLIDRASYRDHQAQLFNELTKALEAEGVFVARYFYDDDPRVCRDESGEQSFHLNELHNKYGTHRLLLFGDGAKLIDPLTGKLEAWTSLLMNWQERAVLTPEPAARWSLRERALSHNFVLLPATLDGMQSLVDYFEAAVTPDLRVWARANGGAKTQVDFDRPISAKMLREHLGKEVFEWLCACAVYPELHWDLTLYLGALPCMGNNLVREQNLLRLIQLPWFRTGTMPDNLRWVLINELPPEKAKAIRTSLIQLLEKNPPPAGTIAEESHRLNLVAQRWLHSRSRERLRELLDLMQRLPRSVSLRDQTLVRYLETAPNPPLNLTLPASLRKVLYPHGLPAFGWKTGARLAATLLLVGVAWSAILALRPRPPQGNSVSVLIAGALPAPTPELYPSAPPPDYTAQNPALDPSLTPPPVGPNANTAGFPSANDFPQATVTTPSPPPTYTPPATGGGGGRPRSPRPPKSAPNAEQQTTTDATTPPTQTPAPTPFPPPTNPAQNNTAQQSPTTQPAEGTPTAPTALTPEQSLAAQDLRQQAAPNKVSKGGTQTEDRARLTAAKAFADAEQLRLQNNKTSWPQAVKKYEEALAGYRSLKDRGSEAAMLNNIGLMYYLMGEREKALTYYRDALTIKQEINNRAGQAIVLSNVGEVYESAGDKNVAQEFYDQSRSVWQSDTSPDKKMKATVNDNRQVKLVDATTGQELRTLSGHTANVFEVAFSPDGKRLATAGDDNTIRIWNVQSGEAQVTFTPGATDYHLTFSPDGKTLTTTETNGRVKVWDAANGKLLSTTEPPAPAQPPSAPNK